MHHERIVVTNRLSTGTCFGVTLGETPTAVFIPQKVAASCDLDVGDEATAQLIPNMREVDRTPYFAIRVAREPIPMTPRPADVHGALLRKLRQGGVWTAKIMAAHLNCDEATTAAAMQAIFASGGCSKFTLHVSNTGGPRNEWFTCYPERADVDEWEVVE
jgi:hypothetical protein